MIVIKILFIVGAVVALLAVLHFGLLSALKPASFVKFTDELAYDARHGDFMPQLKEKAYWGFVFIGAVVLGYGAIHNILFWMPESWGAVEDGEWQPFRDSLAAMLGGFLSLGLVSHLHKSAERFVYLEELRARVKELERKVPPPA